jgi:alcohol dehydrogenase
MVVTGPGRMEMQEFPLPGIGADDGLLEVELVGVCGSDPGIFIGKPARAPRPYPLILGLRLGHAVAIVGPGQQGMAATVVAKETGAAPIMVVGLARDRRRLELCRRLGADLCVCADEEDAVEALSRATHGRMADLVMDVSGHPAGAAQALDLAGTGAAVVLPGLYGAATPVPLLMDKLVFKEIRLLGAFSQDFTSVEAAIGLARRAGYPFSELISHRFPLERAEEAVRMVGGEFFGEPPIKVVIDPAL